jgi:hypothetical protein
MFLALVIGPVGCLYAGGGFGALMILVAIGTALIHPALVLFVWLAGIFMAPMVTSSHNDAVRAEAELMATRVGDRT